MRTVPPKTAVHAEHVQVHSVKQVHALHQIFTAALKPFSKLSVLLLVRLQMLHIGRNVSSDPSKVIHSAHFVLEEVRT